MSFSALIFSAGLGTRLMPLTVDIPKALVEFCDKPLLYHALCKLRHVPVKSVYVNVHHFADTIRIYVDSVRDEFPFEIVISDESELLLDTGGAIKKIAPLLQDGLLAFNVDVLFDLDLNAMLEVFSLSRADACLAVKDRSTSRYLAFDDQSLVGWTNVKTGAVKGRVNADSSLLAFSGIQVLGKRTLHEIGLFPSEVFSIIDFYIASCNTLAIHQYSPDYAWLDVGKYDEIDVAKKFFTLLNKKGAY